MEHLEALTLLSEVRWINPAGGDWAVPSNWSTGRLPGPDDDVLIDLPPDVAVIHSTGTSSIRSLTNRETLLLTGGTLAPAAASTSDGEVQLLGGTLTGAGTLTMNGRFIWIDGALQGPGADAARTVVNGGLFITGTAEKRLGRALVNNGPGYVTGGDVRMTGGGFENTVNGDLDLAGVRLRNDSLSWFSNAGALRARDGVGIHLYGVGLGGTVEVYGPGLGLGQGVAGSVSVSGRVRLFSGAHLGASTDVFGSSATITGEGSVSVNGDRCSIGGDEVNITGNVSLLGMTGNVNTRRFSLGGTLGIDATYGSITSPDFRAAAVGIASYYGASIHNARIVTGSFRLGGQYAIHEIVNSDVTAGTFENNRTRVVDSRITADRITSSGMILERATLTAPEGFTNTGDLWGSGVIAGDVTSSGWVAVGGFEVGVLTITGNFTQTATGILTVELGGTEPGTGYDQLQVGGTATLDGRLAVTLRDGFMPREGDAFEVLTFAERVGSFARIDLPQLDDNLFIDPVYSDISLVLIAATR